ncbi:MAG: (Fe-S)-binding protein [Anaerolineae bacterium]|nr:(Fe-S)-binding protein [Anaerolineae bacterium]
MISFAAVDMVKQDVYLESIALMRTHPCLAERDKIVVVGRPARSLAAVLPYLATLPDVIAYNPELPALTFRRQPGFLTLYADRVTLTQVRGVEEGLALLAALVEAVNATWEHREELVAVRERRRPARPLDVYALLPQSNCGQCGEATCMAFVFALLQQRRQLAECLPLEREATLVEQREALAALC